MERPTAMFDLLDHAGPGSSLATALRSACGDFTRDVLASRGRGTPGLVARAEAEVKVDPRRCIRFDDTNAATVVTAAGHWRGGRFETPTLAELRARAHHVRQIGPRRPGRVRVWIFDGIGAATDIGALQAAAPPGSLFQVASQFNTLESPSPRVVDVSAYLEDGTQGPRAAISALPGTLVRHHSAPRPDGTRFVQQTDGEQLNLLADVADPCGVTIRGGYLQPANIPRPDLFAERLQSRFDELRVGVHDDVDVVLGYDWDGGVGPVPPPPIAQVFTSTIVGPFIPSANCPEETLRAICMQLQRAAYLGTLLAAAALGKERVVLTLIGGGVFANPADIIWNAIDWAIAEVSPLLHRDLTVIVNGRRRAGETPPAALRTVVAGRDGTRTGGGLIRFDASGAVSISPAI